MRIDELKRDDKSAISTLKANTREDYDGELSALIAKYNLKKIGGGKYGIAYAVPGKPYVLKVWPSADNGFSKWAELCMANTNPFMPKLYGKPMKLGNLMGIRMERLATYSNDQMRIPDNTLSRGVKFIDEFLQIHAGNTRQDRFYLENYEWFVKAFPNLLDNKDFVEVSRLLAPYTKMLDLHQNNVMLRRGLQMVFIDPLS